MMFTIGVLLIVAALVMSSITVKMLLLKCKLICGKSKKKQSSRVVEFTNDSTADESNIDYQRNASWRKPSFEVNFDSIDHILRPEELLH